MLSFLYLTSYLQNKRSYKSQNPDFDQLDGNCWFFDIFGAFLHFIMSIQEKFQAALKVIKSLPPDGPYQPSNGTKLKFYSLFKQATEGPCKQPKPGFWDPIGRAKWESWNRLGEITSEEAMNTYIEELKKVCLNHPVSIRMLATANLSVDNIVETMSFNGDVQDFLDSIGPFYEFISLNSPELDNIKDAVDRFTSSSSSNSSTSVSGSSSEIPSANNSLPSSPETTPQDTPVKEAKVSTTTSSPPPPDNTVIVTETTKTIHTTSKLSNGHIPSNQKSSQNHLDTFQLTPGMIPPPSPMHKPCVNGIAKSYSVEENEDETIQVDVNDVMSTVISHPTSTESSDQYYSGDSDVEETEDKSDMIVMKSILPSITVSSSINDETCDKLKPNKINETTVTTTTGAVRKYKSKHGANHVTKQFNEHGHVVTQQHNKFDSVAILQETVDRLNRDIDHVLARLRILEAAYAANPGGSQTNLSNGNNNNPNVSKNRRVRPFRELSTSTWALIFTWPIAVHFLIKLITWWIERRRRLRSRTLLSLK